MSVPFDAADAVRWTGGRLLQGDARCVFRAVSTDTRTLEPDAFFVAIAGPNHDAHAYLDQAVGRGAAGLLIEEGRKHPAGPVVIAVDDTTRALGALAAGHRAGFDGPVVAITGSNGKTTTKEMCAAILEQDAPCLRTAGNLNNQFGLPLTLLRRGPEHASVVVEIGMNHRGEIAPLAAIARPTVAVITNVGTAHIEHLGSQAEIAAEKGDLLAALAPDGVAVVNGDDALARAQAERAPGRVVRFGAAAAADVRCEDVRFEDGRDGSFHFALVTPDGRAQVRLPGLGDTLVANAVGAAAAALAAGAGLDAVARGLGRYEPVGGRMRALPLAGGGMLIDDTYNANPESVAAALRCLAQRKGAARGLAVLGDMGELGESAVDAHREAGALAAKLGIDALVALGEHAAEVIDAGVQAGLDPACGHVAPGHAEAARLVNEARRPGDWVLVKGSRAMRMERVVKALTEGEAA